MYKDKIKLKKKYFYIYKYTLLVNENKLTIDKAWGENEI
jgi:hypothetical protein